MLLVHIRFINFPFPNLAAAQAQGPGARAARESICYIFDSLIFPFLISPRHRPRALGPGGRSRWKPSGEAHGARPCGSVTGLRVSREA